MHHQLMLVSVFYVMGAGTTFVMGVLLSLENNYFMTLLRLEKAQTVPMFGGAILSVFFYVRVTVILQAGKSESNCFLFQTVLMFVMPLVEIKRRQKYYYELVESTK